MASEIVVLCYTVYKDCQEYVT